MLVVTASERKLPLGQPSVNIYILARALSTIASQVKDAPRSRETIIKSNMNPKSFGSYMERETKEGEAEAFLIDGNAV